MRVINVFLLIHVVFLASSIYNATVEYDLAMNTIGKINDADYQYYESGLNEAKTVETPYGKFKTNSRCKFKLNNGRVVKLSLIGLSSDRGNPVLILERWGLYYKTTYYKEKKEYNGISFPVYEILD